MNSIDVVKAGLAAVENRQDDKYQSLLADDMVFTGPVPQPIGKKEFMGLQWTLMDAMPDWKFNAADYKQMGDKVTTMIRITGTQTGTLKPLMPGMVAMPPSGKKVSLPPQLTSFTIQDGKICKIEAEADPDNGVPGILKQLGIPMPQM
jgi:predicted ester cyclase